MTSHAPAKPDPRVLGKIRDSLATMATGPLPRRSTGPGSRLPVRKLSATR